ncbi:protein FAM110C [Scyliorhinus canicula]|uniref:protein FAM110C n=1 Tax=Scyliorhinus canicula TaxID=7830 RepID=UPI0018F4FEDB|nr:protein FAM110C [Scyliorhinus canicula]
MRIFSPEVSVSLLASPGWSGRVEAGAMPTDLSHSANLQPEVSASLPLRILNRGPGYLRRQMEGSSRGRLSAVERLAADKGKYVKSRQATGCQQEAAGFSSSGASEGSSSEEKPAGSPSSGRLFRTPLERSAGPAGALGRRSKRHLRPDSLVIYRQKCEFVKGAEVGVARGNPSLVRRLIQGSGLRDKQLASPEVPKVIIKEGGPGDSEPQPPQAPRAAERPARSRGGGLHRSQSDISCRYSKAFSEFDGFFTYCGLEPEVIEDLGRENFTSASDSLALRIRSVSVPDSESDFSRHSGDNERLLEEALGERTPSSSLSVIERNARVIKWLYGCKRARESRAAELV